jgi:excisionase family DNA binding protein
MQNSLPKTRAALLLTAIEAADALAISPRKLWSLTASHEIPHLRIGRSVRYSVTELERWIDEQTRGGEAR